MTATPGELEVHRAALTGHCYRMLGSAADADDAVQETMVRAWKALDRFDGRASVKTWLYRIATNVCLDTRGDDARRVRPVDDGPAGDVEVPVATRPRTHWIEPIADARAIPADASPAEAALLRESIRLAFVAALQHLPPRQRAALLLTEVLGWSAAEVAEAIDTSVASVNSALQRARATLAARNAEVPSRAPAPVDAGAVARYVDAFARYDVDALAAMLCDDAVMSMPPFTLWLRGPTAIRGFLLGPGAKCRDSRVVPVAACGQPGFAQYHRDSDGVYRAWALVVLEMAEDRVASMTWFLEPANHFAQFELPLELT